MLTSTWITKVDLFLIEVFYILNILNLKHILVMNIELNWKTTHFDNMNIVLMQLQNSLNDYGKMTTINVPSQQVYLNQNKIFYQLE